MILLNDNIVSTLIFSRDRVDKLLALIKEVYAVSDEIVIVDSSQPKNRERLLQEKYDPGDKIKVYFAPALGHPEPYQGFGLSKCRFEWIFYIDTDEVPNGLLKKDIKRIIKNSEYDAFLIRKRELSANGKRYFDSYQRRLYRKSKAQYSGLVFTDPHINGKEAKLDEKYFLDHYFEYYDNQAKNYNYFIICAYEFRKTYSELLNQESRAKLISRFLRAYIRLMNRGPSSELTKFDYKFLSATLLYLGKEIAYNLRELRLPNISFVLHNYFYLLKEYEFLFSYDSSSRLMQLKIAQDIARSGSLIDYLGINEEYIKSLETVERDKGLTGTKLFVSVLQDRHIKDL